MCKVSQLLCICDLYFNEIYTITDFFIKKLCYIVLMINYFIIK